MPVTFVPEVEVVRRVLCVNHVDNMPVFGKGALPTKTRDYHEGQKIHIEGGRAGIYQAVYIPKYDCELKAVSIALSAYNLQDSYDILIGGMNETDSVTGDPVITSARAIVKKAPTIEMAEVEQLELYTFVEAGTPIIVQFYNDSMTEKWLFVKFVTLQDEIEIEDIRSFKWYHEWSGYHVTMPNTNVYIEQIKTPNYHNVVPNNITHIEIIAKELIASGQRIALITYDSGSTPNVVSTFVETDSIYYDGFGNPPLARSGSVVLRSVTITHAGMDNVIELQFERIGSVPDPWDFTGRINMILDMTITNQIS